MPTYKTEIFNTALKLYNLRNTGTQWKTFSMILWAPSLE